MVEAMEIAGAVRRWRGPVGRLSAEGKFRLRDEAAEGPLWVGSLQGGMGAISEWLAKEQDVQRDVWVAKLDQAADGGWNLLDRRGKAVGRPISYSYVAMAHNGKCADALIKTAPIKTDAHAPLRCRFTPQASPTSDRLELCSLWACVIEVPRGAAEFEGAFVEGHSVLSWAGNNSAKYPPPEDAARRTDVWTLISTPEYGSKNKCPQEAIPDNVRDKVSMEMKVAFSQLVKRSSESWQVLHLQLWGAANPVNLCHQHLVHDPQARIGICGDWLTSPSVEGALFSGMALAEAIVRDRTTGLPATGSAPFHGLPSGEAIGSFGACQASLTVAAAVDALTGGRSPPGGASSSGAAGISVPPTAPAVAQGGALVSRLSRKGGKGCPGPSAEAADEQPAGAASSQGYPQGTSATLTPANAASEAAPRQSRWQRKPDPAGEAAGPQKSSIQEPQSRPSVAGPLRLEALKAFAIGPLVEIGANLGKCSKEDLVQQLLRASAAGVDRIILTGCSVKGSQDAQRMVDDWSGGGCEGLEAALERVEAAAKQEVLACKITALPRLFFTAGVHPHDAKSCNAATLTTLRKLASSSVCVAIGECGLDYDRMFSPREVQLEWFQKQVALAVELGMPLFLHERDRDAAKGPRLGSATDLRKILEDCKVDPAKVCIHCFTGSAEDLREFVQRGFYIGLTGFAAMKQRGSHIRRLLQDGSLPVERLMLETDCPFMMPDASYLPQSIGMQARRNEPCAVPAVCKAVAECLQRKPEEVSRITTQTAVRFFGL